MQGEARGQHAGRGEAEGSSVKPGQACVLDGYEDGCGTDLSENFPGSRLQMHHVFEHETDTPPP